MSKGLDTYQAPTVAADAPALKKQGYSFVALYYFASSAFKKLLTRHAAQAISAAGLSLVSVWENGFPTSANYFSAARGAWDGAKAAECALAAGQPSGTVIYAAYDYDAAAADLAVIRDYAAAFRDWLAKDGYTAGAYGSGLVCEALKQAGLVSHTWLSESTGFQAYDEWKPYADMVQHPSGPVLGMDVDADTSAPTGGGGWTV